MASTYSALLGFELQANGENSTTWGTKTNTNLSPLIESAICGRATVNFAADANTSVVISNGADSTGRYFILNVTSSGALTATRNLVAPLNAGKTYIVFNNTTGGQSIQIIGSSGTGVTIPTGKAGYVYNDGTNYKQGFDWLTGMTLAGTTTLTGALAGTSAVWTGSSTATAFIPSGSGVPTNGVYLPAANTVGLAANSTNVVNVTTAGVGIGMTPTIRLDVTEATVAQTARFTSNSANGGYINITNSGTDNVYLGSAKSINGGALADAMLTAPGANNLLLGTGSTERVRITSGGAVGIGMTPTNVLDITQTQNTSSVLSLKNSSAGASANAQMSLSNGTHVGEVRMFGTGYTTAGELRQDGMLIYTSGAGGMTYSIPSDAFRWYIGGSAYLSMTNTTATFGTDITAGHITLNGAGGGLVTLTGFGNTNTIDTRNYFTNDGSGITMQCVSAGVFLSNGASSWAAASERGVKKNLEDIKGNALDIIAAHDVKVGQYVGDAEDAPKQPFLFYEDAIAHFPEATVTRLETTRTDDAGATETIPEFKGIMYDKYVPLLMAGIKALTEHVATLEAKVATLEAAR